MDQLQRDFSPVRQQRSVLARAERAVLTWIARRLPSFVNSDHLSALGLGSMAAAGLAFAAWNLTPWAPTLVVGALAANWFGDSLDGTVARVRNQQRPRYGYYVDHVIDLAGTAVLLLGMGYSGLMSPMTAVALLAAYVLVCAETYLATHATNTFRMSFLGFGPTELRILLAFGVVKAAATPYVTVLPFGAVRLFDAGGTIAAVALAATFVASAVSTTRELYAAEPLPRQHSHSA